VDERAAFGVSSPATVDHLMNFQDLAQDAKLRFDLALFHLKGAEFRGDLALEFGRNGGCPSGHSVKLAHTGVHHPTDLLVLAAALHRYQN
jgi:hypothetical protein